MMFERQLTPFPVAYPSEASLAAGWEGKKHGSMRGRRRSSRRPSTPMDR